MHERCSRVASAVLLAGSLTATTTTAREPIPAAGTAPAVTEAPTISADGAARELDRVSRDVELLKERIEAQDKRFDVQATQLDRTVGWFQTFLTGLGFLLGLAGLGAFFSVQRKAKDEAEKAAREWFEDRAGAFEKRLDKLGRKEEQLRAALSRVEGDASAARQRMLDSESDVKQQAELAKRSMQAAIQNAAPIADSPTADALRPAVPQVPEAAAAALQQIARELSQRLSLDYTLSDWDNLAYAALQSGDHERAVKYWGSAARCQGSAAEIARVLFSRGVVLSQLGSNADAVVVYDELIDRFGMVGDLHLREQVARATRAKGFALVQLGRSEDAVEVFDDLIRQFGDSEAPAIREQVALALRSKAFALSTLKGRDREIAVYNDLLSRFSGSDAPALQEQLAAVLLSKGAALSHLGSGEEALATYGQLVSRFGDSHVPAIGDTVAKGLLNMAITLDDLGRGDEALMPLSELINSYGSATGADIQKIVNEAKARLASKQP